VNKIDVNKIEGTPDRDGFWMPGEFEPHEKCWMIWPERPDTWRLNAKPAQKCFAEVARAISLFEPVFMGVSKGQLETAKKMLSADIHIVEMASNDAWMRDVGPTFVKDAKGEIRGVDWSFNAWGGLKGGLYCPWDKDEKIARRVLCTENMYRYKAPFILEGGSIHVDGQGTVLTTEECLLNPNRNPDLSITDIEDLLKAYLGIKKVIWLSKGTYNDETDGHVDICAALSGPVWSCCCGPMTLQIPSMKFHRMPLKNFLKLLMPGAEPLKSIKFINPVPCI